MNKTMADLYGSNSAAFVEENSNSLNSNISQNGVIPSNTLESSYQKTQHLISTRLTKSVKDGSLNTFNKNDSQKRKTVFVAANKNHLPGSPEEAEMIDLSNYEVNIGPKHNHLMLL